MFPTRAVMTALHSVLLLFLIISISGCTPVQREPTLKKIARTKRIKVGYANEAPYAYYDVYTGKLTGEAPTIAKVILKDLGVEEIEGVLTEFGALIPGLKAGRFDLVAAGMYITPERCKEALFSDPTYGLGDQLVVKKGNPLKLHSLIDIRNHPKAKLGVMSGAIEMTYALEANIDKTRIKQFPDNPSALAGLQSGRIDAFMATSLTLKSLLKKASSPDLMLATPFHPPIKNGVPQKGYGAFVFRKNDTEFRNIFNEKLKSFIGTKSHLDVVKPFGFSELELPGDVRIEDLCGIKEDQT